MIGKFIEFYQRILEENKIKRDAQRRQQEEEEQLMQIAEGGEEEVKITETESMEGSMGLILPAEGEEEDEEQVEDNGDVGDGMKDYQMDEESIAEVDPNEMAMGRYRQSFSFPSDINNNPLDRRDEPDPNQQQGQHSEVRPMEIMRIPL